MNNRYRRALFSALLLMAGTLAAEKSLSPKLVHNVTRFLGTLNPWKKTNIGYLKIFAKIDATFDYATLFKQYMDADIKGFIVHINSGGGSPGTGEGIMRMLEVIKVKKCPVVVLVENSCCSAAYLLATAADHIVAHASAVIGSIGARYTLVKKKNVRQTGQESCEVEYINLSTAPRKLYGDPYTALTPEELETLKQELESSYKVFCSFVSKARGLSLDTSSEWAESRVFIAEDARSLGLIDSIGGLQEATMVLQQLMVARFGQKNITPEITMVSL